MLSSFPLLWSALAISQGNSRIVSCGTIMGIHLTQRVYIISEWGVLLVAALIISIMGVVFMVLGIVTINGKPFITYMALWSPGIWDEEKLRKSWGWLMIVTGLCIMICGICDWAFPDSERLIIFALCSLMVVFAVISLYFCLGKYRIKK